MIDRQASAINHEMRADLGEWIKHRLRRGVQEQGDTARRQIAESGYTTKDLQKQWALQRASQLSIRARMSKSMLLTYTLIFLLQMLQSALKNSLTLSSHCSPTLI